MNARILRPLLAAFLVLVFCAAARAADAAAGAADGRKVNINEASA